MLLNRAGHGPPAADQGRSFRLVTFVRPGSVASGGASLHTSSGSVAMWPMADGLHGCSARVKKNVISANPEPTISDQRVIVAAVFSQASGSIWTKGRLSESFRPSHP